MKKIIFGLGILMLWLGSQAYAFEIYNKTNAEIYAIGVGNTWGTFYFGTVGAGATSKSWLASSINLPATVWVCWYANTGCSYTNIEHSSNSAQTMQYNRHGYVCVTGTYSSNAAPTLQADQTDCP